LSYNDIGARGVDLVEGAPGLVAAGRKALEVILALEVGVGGLRAVEAAAGFGVQGPDVDGSAGHWVGA
jgi:hypothetical protein